MSKEVSVRFETFEKKVKAAGLVAKECSYYHWQVIGGKFLINYFPNGKRGPLVYVAGTNCGAPGSDAIAIRSANDIPKGIEHAGRRPNLKGAKNRMWRNKPHVCNICKLMIEKIEDASVDHVIPLHLGGLNNSNNYKLTHIKCNNEKGHSV